MEGKKQRQQKKKRFMHIMLIVATSLLLEGCGVYKGSFECKGEKGIGCESVSKVNELINEEKLDDFIEESNQPKRSRGKCIPCPQNIKKETEDINEQKREKIRIYFNEYKDERGVLYKPSEVEVEVK